MSRLTSNALIGGVCLSILHLFWLILVAAGWAQALMDFIFKVHMLNSPFQVQPFNLSYAITLLAITFGIGMFYGVAFHVIKRAFNR